MDGDREGDRPHGDRSSDDRALADRSPVDRFLSRFGGVVVAGLGFVITRLFVAEAVSLSDAPVAAVATVGSLVVGLGIVIAGVALAVGAFDPAYVADVSRGCLLGTGAMAVALVATVAATGISMLGAPLGTQLLVANVLLAGAVGGMINGHRKASLRIRQETIMRGANRARFINRLLRHEVLNAATIIDGHAELLRDADADRDRSVDAIRRGASRIESTVNGVGTIAEERDGDVVDLSGAIRSAVDATEDRPEADEELPVGVDPDRIDIEIDSDHVTVAADDRLSTAFARLIEHATDVRDAERVGFETTVDRHTVTVTVADDGASLPSHQRAVLERGAFPEYDDPTSGFELQAVNLLVGDYGGRIRVHERPTRRAGGEPDSPEPIDNETAGLRTRVAITLPRASADAAAATVGVPYPDLSRAAAAGLVAGVAMGGVYWLTSGVLPVIGALYGVESALVGWITHLFHSVVFALLFVAGASTSAFEERISGPLRSVLAGLSFGAVLWLIAAGVVMPLWLRAVGVPTALPNLPAIGLVAHGVWGVTLGYVYVTSGGRFD